MKVIFKLTSMSLVKDLPNLGFNNHSCNTCKLVSQVHASPKINSNKVLSQIILELIHIGLFGPSTTQSYEGNFYALIVIDDFSKYTWTQFLKTKDEAFENFRVLGKSLQNLHKCRIASI